MTTPARWLDLRRYTTARVALGRVGNGLPTVAHLDFQEAHARARDAVWSALDLDRLEADCAPLGLPLQRVASQAADRREYLLRPDLGRRLREADAARLARSPTPGAFLLVIADGLCAEGIQSGAPALLAALVPRLNAQRMAPGPIVLAQQARVALGDEIGEAMQAALVVVLIGERPGLSATDSIGAYLTWGPRRGRRDAERNCLSNIRPGGLSPTEAAAKLAWLMQAAMARGGSGVALKDAAPTLGLASDRAAPQALAPRSGA
jgi:ethanolamine ammonia-lyase small subunit